MRVEDFDLLILACAHRRMYTWRVAASRLLVPYASIEVSLDSSDRRLSGACHSYELVYYL